MSTTATNVVPDTASSEHPGREQDVAMAFGGGLDLKSPPHKIAEGACLRLRNYYYPREALIPRTRPGLDELIASPANNANATAMHTYRKNESTSYVCYSCISDDGTKQELWYQTGAAAPVELTDDLGSLETPSMVTFNGCLLVSLPGVGIYEWQGETGQGADHGIGFCTVVDVPHVDEYVTIGSETWMWTLSRTGPYQVPIYGMTDPVEAAQYLAWCINQDSSIISASYELINQTPCTNFQARRVGTAGNLSLLAVGDSGHVEMFGPAMLYGAGGLHLDLINTNSAPAPGFMIIDQNQRLVASGDPATPDRVFFSTPADPWQWASGAYGGGETFDIGYRDGMDITAIQSMMGELVIHKSGQGREIWRINTADSDPSTWTAEIKKFHANVSAINHRCAASVTDKHLFLDTRGFCGLSGNDTYDEISVSAAGMMLGESLKTVNKTFAFMVVNPDENYIMVFPTFGKRCWVFSYGSGRWCEWVFESVDDITSGCYHDGLQTVLLGTSTGRVLKLDPAIATDDDQYFPSEIITRALWDAGLRKLQIKQTLLDFKNLIEGTGDVRLVVNNGSSEERPLFNFTVADGETDLHDMQDVVLEDALMPLKSAQYGRFNSFSQGGGEIVALRIRLLRGAYALNGLTVRVAYQGRLAK